GDVVLRRAQGHRLGPRPAAGPGQRRGLTHTGADSANGRTAPARRPTMGLMRRVMVIAVVAGLSLVGCGRESQVSQQVQGEAEAALAPANAATLSLTPELGTMDLPISTEIGVNLAGGGDLKQVRLVRAGTAEEVTGKLRADGSSWVPDAPLA